MPTTTQLPLLDMSWMAHLAELQTQGNPLAQMFPPPPQAASGSNVAAALPPSQPPFDSASAAVAYAQAQAEAHAGRPVDDDAGTDLPMGGPEPTGGGDDADGEDEEALALNELGAPSPKGRAA